MATKNLSEFFIEDHLRLVEEGLQTESVTWLAGQVFSLEFKAREAHPEACLFVTPSQLKGIQQYIQTNITQITSDHGNFTYQGPIAWIVIWKSETQYELIQNAAGFYGSTDDDGDVDQLGSPDGSQTYVSGKDTKIIPWKSPNFLNDQPIGIDVSVYHGSVNWQKIFNDGISFAYARASQGSSYQDPVFAENWVGMKKEGVVRGAYHQFNSGQTGAAQAQNFLDIIEKNGTGELAPVLNLGMCKTDPSIFISEILQWLQTVESKLNKKPMLHTSNELWESIDNAQVKGYPIWIASFQADGPTLPRGWDTWSIWQFSNTSTLNGVDVDVDLSYFNGQLGDLRKSDHVPSAQEDILMEPAKETSSSSSKPRDEEYIVIEGDTLTSIGTRFGVSPRIIVETNNISAQGGIHVGQKLSIPASQAI